jgi:SAM-dependent methyltransferase
VIIKKLKLEKRICPVCKGKKYKNFHVNNSYSKIDTKGTIYDYKHVLVICKYCNLVYTNPWLGYKNTNKIYSDSSIGSAFEESKKAKKHFKCFKHFFPNKKILNEKTKILEIGTATGVLLKNIANFYNLKKKNLDGIEPSKKLADKLKGNKYFKIQNKFLNQLTIKKKYDLIIMDNVFEHIEDPEKALKKVKNLMNTNSKLYIAVPNIFKFKNNFRDPFGHTINYYENNIKYLFALNGFKIKVIKKHYNYLNFVATIVQDEEELKVDLKKEFEKKFKINFKKDLEKKFKIVKKFVVTSSQHRKRLLKHYKNIEKDIRQKKSKIILYGASNFALEFLKNTNLNNNILFLTDSNSIYHYKKRFGHKVLPPSDIVNINFDKIIITSGAFSSDIKNEIIKLGIKINRIIQL